MPAFPFTAPIITKEQELAERAALSASEAKQIHDAIYGEEVIIRETHEMLQQGKVRIRSALLTIPDAEKQAYLEALERVPHLVEQESDPMTYLRCEKFDAWSAAKRLVSYWSLRKKVFGPELAFLPMTMAGAMSNDINTLHKGLVTIQPDDDHGRPVVHCDRVRCIASIAPRDAIVRCMFYTMHSVCERVDTQRNGFVIVANLRAFCLYKHFDRMLIKYALMILNAVPAQLKAIHICTGSGKSATELVLPLFKQMCGRDWRMRICLHAGSDLEVLDRLQDYGLHKEHALRFMARHREYLEQHMRWIEEMQGIELLPKEVSTESEDEGSTNIIG